MFTLESKGNPLNKLAVAAGSSYVQNKLSEREQQRQINELQKLNQFDENSSPFEIANAISQLNIPADKQEQLYKVYGKLEEGKQERLKLATASKKAEAESEREQDAVYRYADEAGIPRRDVKGMKMAEAKALIGERTKEPPGGYTSRPIPAEQAKSIKGIREQYKDKSAGEMEQAFIEAGIPPITYKPIVDTRLKEEETSFKKQENLAEQYKKPIAEIRDHALSQEKLIPITEASILNNERYEQSQKLWDSVITSVNSPFLDQFKSKTGQELEAYVPLAVQSYGQKLGGQLTNAKMNLISKKAVGLGKDKNANRLLLYMDLADRKLDIKTAEETNKILANSPTGLAPRDFDEQLRKAMTPYRKMVSEDITRLLDDQQPQSEMMRLSTEQTVPMTTEDGRMFDVPADQVEQAKAAGARLA